MQILIFPILLFQLVVSDPEFRTEQKRYPRVRQAYQEKGHSYIVYLGSYDKW